MSETMNQDPLIPLFREKVATQIRLMEAMDTLRRLNNIVTRTQQSGVNVSIEIQKMTADLARIEIQISQLSKRPTS